MLYLGLANPFNYFTLILIKLSSLTEKIKLSASMIKIEHTLFSLPFVLSAATLALYTNPLPTSILLSRFFFIVLALTGARSAGMALNRIIDRDIDAANPRTASRELAAKTLSLSSAYIVVLISLIAYITAVFYMPRLCQLLSPIPLIWIVVYPYLKRLTYFSHFFLGTTLAGATLGGWIAITGTVDNLAPVYLSLAVMFWVTGFDIIYATQDIDFDKAQGLHSVPSRFGFENALRVARVMHFLTPLFLYLVGETLKLGLIYKLGVLLVIAALFYEQRLVKAGKVEAAFFTVNSWISVLIFVSILLDQLIR